MSPRPGVPRALTIAGSDSGGGAGVQADLKTFASFGVYGTCAVVAVTAQNSRAVTAIHKVPPEVVVAQIEAVMADLGVDAAKTGMLASRLLTEAVAAAVRRLGIPNLVVDPVMVSKDGTHLLDPDAVETLRSRLLPLARVVTPNLPEAEILLGRQLFDPEAVRRAACEIREMGPQNVVIKGGHVGGEPMDLLYDGTSFTEYPGKRVHTSSDHGTGCTFSAAITALLALGNDLKEAVGEAKQFVEDALRAAPVLGAGHGPLDHFFRFRRDG